MKVSAKKTRRILIAAMIVMVVAGALIRLFGNHVLKIGIETAATKALNVGVFLEDVDFSLLAGRISLRNLAVNNPPGYQHDKLLELRDARIAVDIQSLLTDTVDVSQIRLNGVNIVLEQRGVASNNLQDIIKQMPAGSEREDKPAEAGRKLRIDSLEVSDVKVQVKLLPVPGRADTFTFKLPPIKMTNLGADERLSTAVLMRKVLLAITAGITRQGSGLLPEEIIDPIASELKTFKALPWTFLKEGRRVLKEGEGVGKELIEGGKDIKKELTEDLKGLLKSKKDDE